MTLEHFRKADMIIVCGLPGSGKSHFAGMYFRKSGIKRVNRKEIRKNFFEMFHFGEKWSDDKYHRVDESLVKYVEKKTIEHLLQAGEKVLIDNLSVSASSREMYTAIAAKNRKIISAIFINTDMATCIKRNRERSVDDVVPDHVIASLVADIQFPDKREGFKDVLVIEKYEESLR